MSAYIYQQKKWPNFEWDSEQLLSLLGQVRSTQGRIVGKMESLGFDLQNEAVLETLTLEVVKSNEIEGELLNPEQIRSSIARRLGMNIAGLPTADRNVEGVVDMMMDATQNFDQSLTVDRLFDWHAALFPTGRSGMYKIIVGRWRDDSTGPMQVVSGALGKEKVHYQAPDAIDIEREIKQFIDWFNGNTTVDPVIKAGMAHLWFVTIHPFEDGNGRIGRALIDMLLSRADKLSQRFYSMSSQIRQERKAYYNVLEKTQKGTVDITPWLHWFLTCLLNALAGSEQVLSTVIRKHSFWNQHALDIRNDRQKRVLNKILNGFEGKLTSSKWAKLAKCSPDTALRDIQDLMDKQIVRKTEAGGRSTSYELME